MKHVIPRILNRLNVLDKVNLTVHSKVNHKQMAIPIIKKIGYNNLFLSEMWMVQLLTELFKLKPGTFIDIGTNLGQTLIKAKSVDPDIPYIGFEPNPTCVFYMQELIRQNQFTNTQILPVGISNENGVIALHFFQDGVADSSASIVPNFRPGEKITRTEYVPVQQFETLDSDLDLDEVSVVKIDVEGGELEVIEGIESLLAHKRPFVLCEILPSYTQENTVRISRQKAIESILTKLGYCLFRVAKTQGQMETIPALHPLAEFGIHDQLDWCDYVFSPVEFAERLSPLQQVANA